MTPEQFFARARHSSAPAAPCVATVDQWLVHRTGESAMAAGRVVIPTDEAATEMLSQTSLPRWIGHCMKAAGFSMTREPQTGDVGAVVAGNKIVCAVRGERMWLYRSDDGMGAAPLDSRTVGAWRVE